MGLRQHDAGEARLREWEKKKTVKRKKTQPQGARWPFGISAAARHNETVAVSRGA